MYVCLCKGVTESQVNDAISQGCCNKSMIRDRLGVGSVCGSCIPETQVLLDKSRYAQLEIDESILLGV